jgi:hypothetical protein
MPASPALVDVAAHHIQQLSPGMMDRLVQHLRILAKSSGNARDKTPTCIRLGTLGAGSDSIVPMFRHLLQACPRGHDIELDHVFSCEKDKAKRDFIVQALVIGRLNTTHADCQVRACSETDICKRVCYPPLAAPAGT